MDKRLTKRLIALILTGGILISSTGVYTALAASEEYTTSEYTSALVGSDETATNAPETTVPSTSESTTSETTEAETTEKEAESTTVLAEKPAIVPSTTKKDETTTLPPFVEEEEILTETPADNKADVMLGSGTQADPYQIDSVDDLLAMNAIIAEINNNKYFKLTADINLGTIDDSVLTTHKDNKVPGSLISVVPSESSSSNFFHFDGDGHTIGGISTDSKASLTSSQNNALSIFGYVNSISSITNVKFKYIEVNNTNVNAYAAGIILKNEGELIDCSFADIVIRNEISTTTAESFICDSLRVYSGTACIVDNDKLGIINNEGNYQSTLTAEKIEIYTKRSYAGTLVAQNRGKINKVRVAGIKVDGNTASFIGGLVGANLTDKSTSAQGLYYCTIETHSFKGGVKGSGNVGYLVGHNTGRIRYANVNGNFKTNATTLTASNYDLLASGATVAGGIAGNNTGDIQYCNALNIGIYFADATNGAIYGGIVGKTTYGVGNSIATGLTAAADGASNITRYIGGIVGYVESDKDFYVENCYALVKIIDSKVPLGAIVGFNGDNAFKNNKIKNVFYSSIISSRPSPVSYGAIGTGDLAFSKPYAMVNVRSGTVYFDASDFSVSGWGSSVSFTGIGNFRAKTSGSGYTFSGSSTDFSYKLNSTGSGNRTVINYDVNIKLPSSVGAVSTGTELTAEPMEFSILNAANTVQDIGTGTVNDPFILAAYNDINMIYYAPGAHFKVSDSFDELYDGNYTAPSATFWGTIDFNNKQLTVESNKPLFKGIYGSRGDVLTHNNADTHKSTPADDSSNNLKNGVIRNLNVVINASTTLPNVFGNICSATVMNTVITVNSAVTVSPSEEDTGLFAKTVYGNSYIYGCYVDGESTAKMVATKVGVSGFIGTIDADKAIIDNCGANIIVQSNSANEEKIAVFVSTIKALNGGFIQNCYASGGLVRSSGSFNESSCHIFAGVIESQSSDTNIWNCYYSPSYLYNNTNANGVSNGITSGAYTGLVKAWSFQEYDANAQRYKDTSIKIVTVGDSGSLYVETLNNIDRFAADLKNADELNRVTNYFRARSTDSDTFEITNFYRDNLGTNENPDYKVRVVTTDIADTSFDTDTEVTLSAEHNATGLVCKIKVTNASELGMRNGAYVISDAMDLYYLSVHQKDYKENSDEFKYLGASFILDDDIDMTDVSIEPIGDGQNPFTGNFNGDGYTISNLSFNIESNIDQALFGYVKGATISDLYIDKATIIGRTDVAVLVGTVQDGATIEFCEVSNSSVVGESHIGAIVGAIRDKDGEPDTTIIDSCIVRKTTISSTNKEKTFAYIGGIVGSVGQNKNDVSSAELIYCEVTGCTIETKAYGLGGIVGYAPNNDNLIDTCYVDNTSIICTGSNGDTYASLGGVAGLFGGSEIYGCEITGCTIEGECASGVVGRLINEEGTESSVIECIVDDTQITAPNIAGGILAQISSFATSSCAGDKIIDGCKIKSAVTVKALVAGGIVGNVQQFSNKNLTISGCTNLGSIETTGKKGSITDAAGGIVGRLQFGLDTSGIVITGCLSQGTLVGDANLGGIIGMNNANAHTGDENLVTDSYVTTAFSSNSLGVVKGLVIGYVGFTTRNGSANLADNVIYSALNTREALFGNIEETAGGRDLNKGQDGERGLVVDFTTKNDAAAQTKYVPYYASAIVNYSDGLMGNTNVVTLKTNWYVGSNKFDDYDKSASVLYNGVRYESTALTTLVADSVPCFSISNKPKLTGFSYPNGLTSSAPMYRTTASSDKIVIGSNAASGTFNRNYNSDAKLSIQTKDKKCQTTVTSLLSGTVNGEKVTFNVGFTVIVDGNHVFEGTGTMDDPFLIYNAEDLLSIKQHHDNPKDTAVFKDPYLDNPEYYYEAYYMVMNDIDLSEYVSTERSLAPIGSADSPFGGKIITYRNEQYKISGLIINDPKESIDYALSDSYKKADGTVTYSDALGLFGYTDGAEIYNLELENVQITATPSASTGALGSVTGVGMRTGALIGVAKNTVVNNVKVTGESNIDVSAGMVSINTIGSVGGIVGKAEDNVVLSDVAFIGSGESSGIKSKYYVGGIIGSSADSTGTSVTNPVVENIYVTNVEKTGEAIAGGIAGQFAGVITGTVEEKDNEGNVITSGKYATVNNVTVTGMVVGGVVGSGNVTNKMINGITHDLSIELTEVKNVDVKVHDDITDRNLYPNAYAGGILGRSPDSYGHEITGCTVDADTTVTSYYCAGGIVGRADNNGGVRGQRDNTLIISDCSTFAKVTQTYEDSLSEENLKNAGAGAVIGVIGLNANVMNGATKEPQIRVANVTASGVVKGENNIGGIVGAFASTQSMLYQLTDSLVYDCIISAKLDTTSERAGIIFGSIEGNLKSANSANQEEDAEKKNAPFPDLNSGGDSVEYNSRIVDKVFYSSYMTGSIGLYGLSVVGNYQGKAETEGKFSAAEALSVYNDIENGVTSTIFDVNKLVYNYNHQGKTMAIPISIVKDGLESGDPKLTYQWFGDKDYLFSAAFKDVLTANDGSGNPFGFTISGKDFTLVENGIQSSDEDIFVVINNPDANAAAYPYKITGVTFGAADLVFTYTNGLKIGIPTLCGMKVSGSGTISEPFEVPDADTFALMVPILASATDATYFKQTDSFNMADATMPTLRIEDFGTAIYDGGGYSITGYSIAAESSALPVGIFGKVSGVRTDGEGNAIPNIKDLTLIDCTVNGGSATEGVGIVAGELSNGATISNVKVQGGSVISDVGPIGGAVGIVTSGATLDNVSVDGTTVETAKGSAGGLVGIMPDNESTIIVPVVKNAKVSIGSFDEKGNFLGANSSDDIAGGIVAQAFGTIKGSSENSVENTKVYARVAGGAVGAVYKTNTSGLEGNKNLTLEDVKVSSTTVNAKYSGGAVGAGLLGWARDNNDVNLTVTFKNCYVDKKSVVNADGSVAYGAGALAQVDNSVDKIEFVDTEAYASVNSTVENNSGSAYAASLIAYIDNSPNIVTFDGCVAGGKLTAKAIKTFVAGVFGGFSSGYASTAIDGFFFRNGVISAETECIDGNKGGSTVTIVHRRAKFIAGYNEEMFADADMASVFSKNYYSSYPEDITFFANDSGEKAEKRPVDIDMTSETEGETPFSDINIQGNLTIADEYKSSWNSVAITKNKNEITTLYAKLSEDYAQLPYGSENNQRFAEAAGGFDLKETALDADGKPLNCIDFDKESIRPVEDETGVYEFKVTPIDYGAEDLVAEYTCGLKTTAQIISVEILGSGVEDDPFLISTPTQLRIVAYLSKGNHHFRQVNDIDLSGSYNEAGSVTDEFIHYNGGKFYAPIGTENAPFDGVYDGQGYKITGVKSNRAGEDNIGIFGYVSQNGTTKPTIKNLHVELLVEEDGKTNDIGIVGKNNVGGIAGNVQNAVIENCSVANGAVTGQNYVGGIAGNFTDSQIRNCFTQSDVSAFGDNKPYAGGIVGFVNLASENVESIISGCFASGSVYASVVAGSTSDRSNAAGIVAYVQNAKNLTVANCLFTGTTSSGFGIAGALNTYGGSTFTITNCIDAGQNVAMENNIFTKLSTAVAPRETLNGIASDKKVNVYYDNSLLKTNTTEHSDDLTGVTGKTTAELIAMNMGEGWTSVANHYPVPSVPEIEVVTYERDEDNKLIESAEEENKPVFKAKTESVDYYSDAYAKFLSAPVYSDANECNDVDDADYGKGLVYPVTLLTSVNGAKVTYSSSVFDRTDKGEYPTYFDNSLYGIKSTQSQTDDEGNPVDVEVIDKNTDLLFGDNAETGKTTVYRNIFETTSMVGEREKSLGIASNEEDFSKNTRVDGSAKTGGVFDGIGEAYYNTQVPVVYASATINGVDVQRDIKIPLSYGTTYCIATQRQLYALGGSEKDLNNGDKFKNYYASTNNYKLITDIDCSDVEILFNPIGQESEYGYSGHFDGCGYTISNFDIYATEGADRVGMFSKVSKDYKNNAAVNPSISNLTLKNVTVIAEANTQGNGGSDVGTLVGLIDAGSVTIENCHAIGEVEYKRDKDGNIEIDDNGDPIIESYIGSVVGEGSYIGGLIGRIRYTPDDVDAPEAPQIISCSSTVMVSGSKDAVGGLIGQSAGNVNSCYATGNVICDTVGGKDQIYGIGGLIGIMTNGKATESFASGNVEIKSFNVNLDRKLYSGKIGIGGFVGFVDDMKVYNNETKGWDEVETSVITGCFSGGNVKFGFGENAVTDISSKNNDILLGIGGFSGVNREKVNQAYSSAVVKTRFNTIADESGTHGVGIGGVAGIAFDNIEEVYSSGSVAPACSSHTEGANSYYNVGGAIGKDNATCTKCYYDSWTNADPNLTAVGGEADTQNERSFTTKVLTSGSNPNGAFGEVWGFTEGAYPYLTALLNEDSDPYIKTNSILSVICVNIQDDDVSAKTQKGITQALTVPTEFTYTTYDEDTDDYKTVSYSLEWAGATLDTKNNRAAVIRTRNTQETVKIVAQVTDCSIDDIDYREYAMREYERLCADMRGTFEQPYLIGAAEDLTYMNMSADKFSDAQAEYPEYYGQWATPIDEAGNPIYTEEDGKLVSGIVHYQLMSDIDVKELTESMSVASAKYSINDNDIYYKGFMLLGNGYSIKNGATEGYFFNNVNEASTITNIIFDSFTFTGNNSSIVNTNNGTLQDVYVRASFSGSENIAGLVLTNEGTIDGCVVDATITDATTNVGVMAVTNNGTIINSGTAGTLKTGEGSIENIGAFVADNNGTIEDSFSMADVDVNATSITNLSGFAAVNSGIIDRVYTRSGISFANTPADTTTVGLLAGKIESLPEGIEESVTNSYAAAYLGYYNESQDSILFGTVPEGMKKLTSVYVDKSLAGTASKDSYKYSASLSSIMSMQYMPGAMIHDAINNPDGFIAKAEKNVLPQHASIINAQNHRVVDEKGDLIYVDENGLTYINRTTDEKGNLLAERLYICSDGTEYVEAPNGDVAIKTEYEDGTAEYTTVVAYEDLTLQYSIYLEDKTIIRNYDVLKAYSEISTMAIRTGQSQYIDRLVPDSSDVLNSTISNVEGITYIPESNTADIVGFSGVTMSTKNAGTDTVIAKYSKDIVLLRNLEITPKLRIDVKVDQDALINTINPNFTGGIGTKENPYIIGGDNNDEAVSSLQSLHYYGTESDLYFVLGNDIDMKGVEDFQIHHFTAHLNDNTSNDYQYTIENFNSDGHGGLFGSIEGGAVVNNIALTGTIVGSEQYTGALANVIKDATVTNCVVAADVTSTFKADTQSPSTGILAGSVTGLTPGENVTKTVISGIVTTGKVTAESGVAGGVIGSAQNAEMKDFLSTAYVETIKDKVLAAGIVGEMFAGNGETTTLTNAIFGGFADGYEVDPTAEKKIYNIYPIVAEQSAEQGVVTVEKAYYDNQSNNKILVDGTVGTGLKTKDCEKLAFENSAFSNSLGNGYYPIPIAVEGSDSFNATALLAAVTMNFYLGSSVGEKGLYTTMQFIKNASAYGIECEEISDGEYFAIETDDGSPLCIVKTKTYNESIDPEPSIRLTVVKDEVNNGAVRIIVPGLSRNANITYTLNLEENSTFSATEGQLLGVLLRSVAESSVNVLNDFVSADEIGTKQDAVVLAIAEGMDGFYVDEMLPSGYEFVVSGTVNETITLETVETAYGTKIVLPEIEPDENGNIRTDVELTLIITKVEKPWGVNSIFNTLWK